MADVENRSVYHVTLDQMKRIKEFIQSRMLYSFPNIVSQQF